MSYTTNANETTFEVRLHDNIIWQYKCCDDNDYLNGDDFPEEVEEKLREIWESADEDAEEYLELLIDIEYGYYSPASTGGRPEDDEPAYSTTLGYDSKIYKLKELYE